MLTLATGGQKYIFVFFYGRLATLNFILVFEINRALCLTFVYPLLTGLFYKIELLWSNYFVQF